MAGRGGATVGAADDLSTFIINPAGLSKVNNIQLMGDFYNLYQAGFENTMMGLFLPVFHYGGLAFLWKRVNMEQALEFDNYEDAFYVNISKELLGIEWGINSKYYKEVLNSTHVRYHQTGYEFDLGVKKSFNMFGAGFSVLNLKNLIQENVNFESMINAGVWIKPIEQLNFLMDYKRVEEKSKFNFGLEYSPVDEIILRGGWYLNFYYGFGVSYYISHVRVDYAFSLSQYELGTTHYFSILYEYSL